MLVIGIAGGTGSGKTTVAQALKNAIDCRCITILSQDSYYRDHPTLNFVEREKINYDHPDAFENSLMIAHIKQLKQGNTVDVPVYDFALHRRKNETVQVEYKPIIVVEGILILADPDLRNIFDVKVFVDTDSDVRVLRRITRDINERGRTLESVHNQYMETVKPMHDAFIEPSKRYADIIIPEGGHNEIAINMLTSWVKNSLK